MTQMLSLLLVPVFAAGQPPARPEEGGGKGGGARSAETRRRVREMFHEMAMLKIRGALDLDDATAAKLEAAMKQHSAREAEVQKKTHAAREALRAELDAAKPDEKKLAAQIDAIAATREEMHRIHMDRLREARKILPVEKAARLVLLFPRIERKLRKMIEEAEGDDGPRGPGGGRHGPGGHGGKFERGEPGDF